MITLTSVGIGQKMFDNTPTELVIDKNILVRCVTDLPKDTDVCFRVDWTDDLDEFMFNFVDWDNGDDLKDFIWDNDDINTIHIYDDKELKYELSLERKCEGGIVFRFNYIKENDPYLH